VTSLIKGQHNDFADAGQNDAARWPMAENACGTLIIALFGLFEKRRDDVLRVVEQLRQWEA
jgi:hypothetical protein